MTDLTQNDIETSNSNQESASSATNDKPKKHRFLKLFAKIFLTFFILFFIISRCSLYQNENTLKTVYIDTNNFITKQQLTIDRVKIDFKQGVSRLNNISINNPEGFSPSAITADEIIIFTRNDLISQIMQPSNLQGMDRKKIKEIIQKNQENKNQQTYGTVIGNLTINYEIVNGKVNLHQIVDNIVSSLKTNESFSPLAIYDLQQEYPLNYNGNKFKVEKLVIVKPQINIFRDKELIQSIKSEQNIVIMFDDIKQPTTYAHYLLASSLKLVNILDNLVN